MTLAQFLVIFFGPVALLAVFFFFAWLTGRKKLPH
jgi:preprotein translocase subunit YajC